MSDIFRMADRISQLEEEVETLRATCHLLQAEQEQLQKENAELRAPISFADHTVNQYPLGEAQACPSGGNGLYGRTAGAGSFTVEANSSPITKYWATISDAPGVAPQQFYRCEEIDPLLSTLRQQQAETQQELAAERRHIKILEHALIEHSEFGGLFQPGGKYHGIAPLRLGTSAVVEGGKWLDAQYTTLQASLRSLVAQWRDLAASAYWPSAIRFADQLAALVPLPPQEETKA